MIYNSPKTQTIRVCGFSPARVELSLASCMCGLSCLTEMRQNILAVDTVAMYSLLLQFLINLLLFFIKSECGHEGSDVPPEQSCHIPSNFYVGQSLTDAAISLNIGSNLF